MSRSPSTRRMHRSRGQARAARRSRAEWSRAMDRGREQPVLQPWLLPEPDHVFQRPESQTPVRKECANDIAGRHAGGVNADRPVFLDRDVDGPFDQGPERGVAAGRASGKAEVTAFAGRRAAALIPEVGAAGEVKCMYFDTRFEPARFNLQLAKQIAQVHL